jgi:hypothetical protein
MVSVSGPIRFYFFVIKKKIVIGAFTHHVDFSRITMSEDKFLLDNYIPY